MKIIGITATIGIMMCSLSYGAERRIEMSSNPGEVTLGDQVSLQCLASGDWQLPIISAKIIIKNAQQTRLINRASMSVNGNTATYLYEVPSDQESGNWKFKCIIKDQNSREKATTLFPVTETATLNPFPPAPEPEPELPIDPPVDNGDDIIFEESSISAHNTITEYNGPSTCISCHAQEADEMLDSLHMKWSGPTPDLINTNGEELGKAVGGINTFCTYAVSSKGACYSCHVRADGNAPHPPEANDVDCLMCHSDTYQRKVVADPNNTETVTNINGESATYVFGKTDAQGNYTSVPDYDKMPVGTNMVNVARTVHMPTSQSCLRCHAKAGGSDWAKRGDIGLSSANPPVTEDVHLSQQGANLSCVDCHSALNHKISGRGIDLRQTEAPAPTCQACHTEAPHADATLNRHAQGQLSCQVCHIREFAKGGETEMARDWQKPEWNAAFCSGQGGFIGEETKAANVKPEYVWFDGSSYVYNIGETITPDERGIYPMAKASGKPFDGKSSIVPIKRHVSTMPLHESGKIIPPAIMWMFMTGDFDMAVQKGMEDQGMTGNYSIVEADAEMLISHGVEPKESAPSCIECHTNSGATPDGSGMVPFAALGYHDIPDAVKSCVLCHEKKSLPWESMHQKHRADDVSCVSCHTSEPTGFIQSTSKLCSSCHENKSWKSEGHKKHFEKGLACADCHTFK